MSDDNLVPRQKQMPSFEEFKEVVLRQGANQGFLNKILTLHGKIPRLIRILHNFDRTGLTSALDQLINEEKSEQEKESILRAIYDLAILVWNIKDTELPSLSNDAFC